MTNEPMSPNETHDHWRGSTEEGHADGDPPPGPAFDDLALIAAAALAVPIAFVTVSDGGHHRLRAACGLDAARARLTTGLSTRVAARPAPLVIADLHAVPEMSALAGGVDEIRFYAAAPLRSAGGAVLGTLAVADRQPRQVAPAQVAVLEALARQAAAQLERARGRRTAELEQAVQTLRAEIRDRQSTEEALRRSQEQLVQAQKLQAVGQLAGGIAHEFNNILTVVFGYLSVLELEFETGDPRRLDIRRIAESADRAALLTRQLLAFSRHQRFTPQLVDLNHLLARQERMLTRLVGEKVRVVLALSDDECPVRIDPAHLEQVVLNLAINARDAMPDGGTFHVDTAVREITEAAAPEWGHVEAGRYATLTVTDSGRGMTAEVLARMYEPFFTTKEVGQGPGLGLSTVYGIVAQNGGHIRAASTPGRGTTFSILLPLTAAAATAPAGPGAPPARPRGAGTILLVEDEQELRDLAASILRRAGFWVLEATDGLDALALAAREPGPIHLLLTDIVMPGMTGAGLTRRLLVTRPDTRVLYMSGYTNNPETLGLARDSEFIGKPFTPAALLGRVRSLLDGDTVPGSVTG